MACDFFPYLFNLWSESHIMPVSFTFPVFHKSCFPFIMSYAALLLNMYILSENSGKFCTESVAMTLKIMCTYAHYVTLGSRCKMASSHRVTDLEKNSFRISKDEAPTPFCVLSFHNRLDLIREPAFYWVFYFPNLSLFVSLYM